MNRQQLQIYRVIDKADKLGRIGVFELLQKPYEEFGANLDALRSAMITDFVFSTKDCPDDKEMEYMMKSITDIVLMMKIILEESES